MRTLYYYLGKELFRVSLLALAAFTLVMTILGLIEPLRKGGLAGNQIAMLIAYTMPVMLTLTLPVATLFAATIVYGRFAQDNEFMACRASGVSAWTILKPAMLLGAIVTVVSLTLSNFVTPEMARAGEKVAKADARGMIYHKLNAQGYFRSGQYVISADWVDTDKDKLYGVAVADTTNSSNVRILVATSAQVSFSSPDTVGLGDSFVTVTLENPVLSNTGDQEYAIEDVLPILERIPIPSLAKEKTAFYSWPQLSDTLADMSQQREVAARLESIATSLRYARFGREVWQCIEIDRKPYELKDARNTYLVKATHATVVRDRTVELRGSDDGKDRVEVTQMRDGKPDIVMTADTALLLPDSGDSVITLTKAQPTLVALELRAKQGVMISNVSRPDAQPIRKEAKYPVGRFMLPDTAIQAGENVTLESIKQPNVISDKAGKEFDRALKKISGTIVAEMHSRVAFGVSCFLLVALGSALGLIFRGGQIITAFAIVVAPALLVFVMILMGKDMVADPDIQKKFGMSLGLAAIWGGIVILAIANVMVYLRLLRR